MSLSIQERLKDLRVQRGLTLEQLAEQTNLSKSALGSYEADDFKDISHYALIKLMADLEIYVNGTAVKQVQSANAIVDAMSAMIMKQHNPGLTDPQLRQLIAAHIDDDSFCRYIIQQDIDEIAAGLREAHREDFFSVPEDNPLKGLLEAATEITNPDSDPEQAFLAFICKRLRLNFKKLSGEEKKWLKKIAQKSDLLKKPTPQRGRK